MAHDAVLMDNTARKNPYARWVHYDLGRYCWRMAEIEQESEWAQKAVAAFGHAFKGLPPLRDYAQLREELAGLRELLPLLQGDEPIVAVRTA